eukprot:tig00000219_g19534.t1
MPPKRSSSVLNSAGREAAVSVPAEGYGQLTSMLTGWRMRVELQLGSAARGIKRGRGRSAGRIQNRQSHPPRIG